MKRLLPAVALLLVSGTGCTVNLAEPAHDPTSAAPSVAASTATPTLSMSPSAALSTPRPSKTPTKAPVVVYSLGVSCSNFFPHSSAGAKALTKLGEHPDGKGLTRKSFAKPRDALKKDSAHAPESLRPYLNQMVAVLQSVVNIYDTGVNPPSVKTDDYRLAGLSAVDVCEGKS